MIGAAQSMGIQSKSPASLYLEHATGMPVIVLGWGGNGARFFVDRLTHTNGTKLERVLKELVSNAKVVVVQAMSGRSEGSTLCENGCANMYCVHSDEPVERFLDSLTPTEKINALREMKENWVKSHTDLLRLSYGLRNPTIENPITAFLYISSHHIDDKPDVVFPQLVDGNSLQAVEVELERTIPFSFSLRVHHGPAVEHVPILNPNLCKHNCSSQHGDLSCAMEKLTATCGCSKLTINYYPTPLLQAKAGQVLGNEIRRRSKGLNPATSQVNQGLPSTSSRFLLLQSKGRVSLNKRSPTMLIDSLCYHHKHVPIYLFLLAGSAEIDDDFASTFVGHGCSLTVREISLEGMVRGTPTQAWIMGMKHIFQVGDFWYSHVTDLFRLVAPWLFGGFYLDTDFVITQPIAHFRNVLVYETQALINNAISVFDKGHPFLEFTMKMAIRSFDPSVWGSLGPLLVTNAMKEWQKMGCPGPKCINVLPARAAFGIPWRLSDTIMRWVPDEQNPYRNLTGVYAVHYFNKVTANSSMTKDSALYNIYRSNCVVCNSDLAVG